MMLFMKEALRRQSHPKRLRPWRATRSSSAGENAADASHGSVKFQSAQAAR